MNNSNIVYCPYFFKEYYITKSYYPPKSIKNGIEIMIKSLYRLYFAWVCNWFVGLVLLIRPRVLTTLHYWFICFIILTHNTAIRALGLLSRYPSPWARSPNGHPLDTPYWYIICFAKHS